MKSKHDVLILGASYGSLLAAKLMLAGNTVRLVCLPAEAELINREGFRVRMPVKGREGHVEIDSHVAEVVAVHPGHERFPPGEGLDQKPRRRFRRLDVELLERLFAPVRPISEDHFRAVHGELVARPLVVV